MMETSITKRPDVDMSQVLTKSVDVTPGMRDDKRPSKIEYMIC